jgi:hypothetical protein
LFPPILRGNSILDKRGVDPIVPAIRKPPADGNSKGYLSRRKIFGEVPGRRDPLPAELSSCLKTQSTNTYDRCKALYEARGALTPTLAVIRVPCGRRGRYPLRISLKGTVM